MKAIVKKRENKRENKREKKPEKKRAARIYCQSVLKTLAESNPDAACELVYRTPFELLVSVVLSAQATDKSVNSAMLEIHKEGFLTPKKVLSWGPDKLLSKIRRIGLAPTKAKNVVKLSESIMSKHSGEVPSTRDELEALAGVGRKTASVILGEIFGEPTLAVDTHVFRVTQRLGWHLEKTPDATEKTLLKLIPSGFLPKAHHLLILHGRYTCTARSPKCAECVVSKWCPSKI